MRDAVYRPPALLLVLSCALLTALLLLVAPHKAAAHEDLLSSNPENGDAVESLPANVVLSFGADVLSTDGAAEVVVTDPDGRSVTDGSAVVNGAVVTQPLIPDAPGGQYRVVWKIVSGDGHPTSGELSFKVIADEATTFPLEQPRTSATATAESNSSATPDREEASKESPPIWPLVLSGAGILAVIGVATIAVVRSRSRRSQAHSRGSAER